MTWKPAKAEDLALVKAKKLARRAVVLCVLLFGDMAWGAANDGFSLSAKVELSAPRAETLYEYPGLLRLVLRQAGADQALRDYDEKRGNYLNFPLADGSVPVLEAELRAATNLYRVGVPLAYLKRPDGLHDLRVVLAKTRLRLLVDGAALDEDYLISLPAVTGGVGRVFSPRLKDVAFAAPAPAGADGREPDVREIKEPVQYWTGNGFNTWVGDVVCCRWRDRLHLFYLLDRRHHASKHGQGGHIFAHISSSDLVRWFEHPTVVPIENTWMTAGTGTPFEWNGKLCLSYGIHSTRMVPREKTTEPAMLAAFEKTGEMSPVRFAGTNLVPLGASWAESEDGIRFSHSGIVCHTTQNPGISVQKDGSLRLVTGYWDDTGAKGVFTSKDLLHWRQTGEKPILEGDCPCDFTWNGYHYLLQGFNGYARAKGAAPLALDRASDIYDGLSVPMVAAWGENRRLLIGWQHYPQGHWGGWLVFRELVQREDGSLGTKWVKEISPPTPAQTWRVKGGERFELKLARSDGRYPQAFTVDPKTSSAFLSVTLENGEIHRCWTLPRLGIAPVTGIRGLNADYCVRAVLHYDRKADATLLDAEIAGNRTFVTSIPGRYAIRR